MIDVVEYKDSHVESWSDYVERSPDSTIAHQIGWRRVMEIGLGHKPHYFVAFEGCQVKGILPLFEIRTWWRSRFLVSLPWIDYGGICADSLEVEKSLLEAAQGVCHEINAEFIEMRSINPGSLGLAIKEDKVTFLLKLETDSQAVWKGFDPKLRNLIRKAQKANLTTELSGANELRSFYKVFAYNMRDLGTPVWGLKFFQAIMEEFKDSARLILVKKDGQVIAGGLVLAFKDRLYVPSASAYRAALQYAPNYALYWAVIKDGCQGGYRYFDFGRSSWNSNTFNFKKQWVAEPVQLNWQYHLYRRKGLPEVNPSNPKYRLMISLWQKLPLSVANFLGPKVIRNFP
jgi:FemAB-related protein (PEP-CTERM system-associated)